MKMKHLIKLENLKFVVQLFGSEMVGRVSCFTFQQLKNTLLESGWFGPFWSLDFPM